MHDGCMSVGKIDNRVSHTDYVFDGIFHAPDTGGAGHAAHGNNGFLEPPVRRRFIQQRHTPLF